MADAREAHSAKSITRYSLPQARQAAEELRERDKDRLRTRIAQIEHLHRHSRDPDAHVAIHYSRAAYVALLRRARKRDPFVTLDIDTPLRHSTKILSRVYPKRLQCSPPSLPSEGLLDEVPDLFLEAPGTWKFRQDHHRVPDLQETAHLRSAKAEAKEDFEVGSEVKIDTLINQHQSDNNVANPPNHHVHGHQCGQVVPSLMPTAPLEPLKQRMPAKSNRRDVAGQRRNCTRPPPNLRIAPVQHGQWNRIGESMSTQSPQLYRAPVQHFPLHQNGIVAPPRMPLSTETSISFEQVASAQRRLQEYRESARPPVHHSAPAQYFQVFHNETMSRPPLLAHAFVGYVDHAHQHHRYQHQQGFLYYRAPAGHAVPMPMPTYVHQQPDRSMFAAREALAYDVLEESQEEIERSFS